MPTLQEYLAMMQPQEPSQREKLMSALGAMGVGLLSAPNWQKGLARGGLLAYDAQQNAKDRSAQDSIAKLRQYQAAQQMADTDAQREKQAALDKAAAGAFMPGRPGSPQMGPPTAQGDMQPAVPAQAPGFDYAKYLATVAPIDPQRAMQVEQAMRPKAEESPFAKLNPKDYTRESLIAFMKSKNPSDLVPVAPAATPDSPFAKINPGDFTPASIKQFVDGGMKDPSVLRKAQPAGGAVASAPEPKWDASSGQFVYPPSAASPTGKAVQPSGYVGKGDQSDVKSQKALVAIKEAEDIIDKATGSYAGTAADFAARVVGASTGGAEAIAKLKVIEAAIMMNQPRMEGPQSNLDVAMYRQAAGQLGDPTVPNDIKRAALETIKSLHSKYGSLKGGVSAGATGEWSIEPARN